MVAVVIICVGLLGIAKMQALSLSSTTHLAPARPGCDAGRQYRLGHALEPRVLGRRLPAQPRSTPAISLAGTGTVTSTTDAATATQAQKLADGEQYRPSASAPWAPPPNATTSSSPPSIWRAGGRNRVVPMLPNATATIACNSPPVGNPAPISCTVVIGWNERAVALNTQSALAGQTFETPDLHAVRGALMDRHTRMRSARAPGRLHPGRADGDRGHRHVPAGGPRDHRAEHPRQLLQPAAAGAAAGRAALRAHGPDRCGAGGRLHSRIPPATPSPRPSRTRDRSARAGCSPAPT